VLHARVARNHGESESLLVIGRSSVTELRNCALSAEMMTCKCGTASLKLCVRGSTYIRREFYVFAMYLRVLNRTYSLPASMVLFVVSKSAAQLETDEWFIPVRRTLDQTYAVPVRGLNGRLLRQ
jgi:hypothetical protein